MGRRLVCVLCILCILCILLLSLCILLLSLCIGWFKIIRPALEVVGVCKLCDGGGNGIKCRTVRNGTAY